MKKLLFISLLTVFILSSCACPKFLQSPEDDGTNFGWNKGDVTATARANFSTSSQGDNKDNEFKINPCVGTFISDKVELGLGAKYATTKQESESFEDKSNTFAVGPYARWYCTPEKRFSPYLETELRYSTTNFETAGYKQNGLDASLGFGFNYFLTDRLSLNAGYAGLQYQNLSDDRDGVDNLSTFSGKFNSKRLRLGAAFKF